MSRRCSKGTMSDAARDLDDSPLDGQQVAVLPVPFQDVAGRADGPAVRRDHSHSAVVFSHSYGYNAKH